MSRSVAIAILALAGVAAFARPGVAAAHAIGGTFTLPVPTGLYLLGAAIAVASSFVVTAFVAREPAPGATYAARPVPDALSVAARWALRGLGLMWWYGAIAAGLVVNEISPLPAVLLWIGVWVALPIVALMLGNPWPSLSPFRTTFTALEWLAGRLGVQRLDLELPYSARLGRWPAVALLAVGLWAELVLPAAETPRSVAVLMSGYTILTLTGMIAVGPVAWLRSAEVLEIELGWFGRIGPVGRRSRSRDLCEACGEGCDPARCVDCPECAVAAEDGERGAEVRPWVAGLTETARTGWSDAAFILLLLAGVTYDGLGETQAGALAFTMIYPALAPLFGSTSMTTFLLVEAVQLGGLFLAFFILFAAVASLTRRLAGGRSAATTGAVVGRYATTLLPIAGGYLVAHYMTLAIQGIIWLPSLLADPLATVAPSLDFIPVGAIWYGSIAAIVGGHVAAVVLAHRLALADAGRRATLAGLPLVILMIGYTVLSLWIVAAPIVVDPAPPTAIRP